MVFSSLIFLYAFLPLCIIATRLVRTVKAQNVILLLFSLFFYAWGEPVWVLLMIATVFGVWLLVLAMERSRSKAVARIWLTLSIVLCLTALAVFKYSGFFFATINDIVGTSLPENTFSLPIGISFYTFQTLTYIIDVYRGEAAVQKNFYKLMLYVSLFPQLIAGPIVRYSDIAEQIDGRRISFEETAQGIGRFLIGLAKKVLIANHAAEIVALTLESTRLSSLDGLEAWIGILSFTIQIYFDFSGYSDMAIGLGHMFGFRFKENFNYPYVARSVTDFWRRWHISLSTFFRDYVYIPLGGNRLGLPRQILNMFIVWSLTGLWHGAAWNFVLWGIYYFVLLTVEKLFLLRWLEKLPAIIGHIYTWMSFILGWVFFKMESMSGIATLLQRMFQPRSDFVTNRGVVMLQNHLIFVVIAFILAMPLLPWLRSKKPVKRLMVTVKSKEPLYGISSSIVYMGILFFCTMSLVASGFNPFLYFRF
ncbi:MAG: MBOAT family protein [Eubacteriales bacterium]|nr:MBOAT family protein [Eubacteriales bacterium]MDD4323310.1 MBOAT family protein [Eubacteriales bacterium]MDD4540579.1 MBOAT family protein [Eubacteriales bacterium]